MDREQQEARRYAILLRYARLFASAVDKDDAQEIVQEAVAAALHAKPGTDWLDLPTNYYAQAIRSRVFARSRSRGYGPNHVNNPDSLDRLVVGGSAPVPLGWLTPGRHDTEREALTNITLEGVLRQSDDPDVRLLLAWVNGYVQLTDVAQEAGVSSRAMQHYKRRAIAKLQGRPLPVATKDRTHCPQGHEYSAENTYVNKNGKRYCRACRVIHRQAAQARKVLEGAA